MKISRKYLRSLIKEQISRRLLEESKGSIYSDVINETSPVKFPDAKMPAWMKKVQDVVEDLPDEVQDAVKDAADAAQELSLEAQEAIHGAADAGGRAAVKAGKKLVRVGSGAAGYRMRVAQAVFKFTLKNKRRPNDEEMKKIVQDADPFEGEG